MLAGLNGCCLQIAIVIGPRIVVAKDASEAVIAAAKVWVVIGIVCVWYSRDSPGVN
jgi:hypothetical protein